MEILATEALNREHLPERIASSESQPSSTPTVTSSDLESNDNSITAKSTVSKTLPQCPVASSSSKSTPICMSSSTLAPKSQTLTSTSPFSSPRPVTSRSTLKVASKRPRLIRDAIASTPSPVRSTKRPRRPSRDVAYVRGKQPLTSNMSSPFASTSLPSFLALLQQSQCDAESSSAVTLSTTQSHKNDKTPPNMSSTPHSPPSTSTSHQAPGTSHTPLLLSSSADTDSELSTSPKSECSWDDSADEDEPETFPEGELPKCCNCRSTLSLHSQIYTCKDGRRRWFCLSCPSPRHVKAPPRLVRLNPTMQHLSPNNLASTRFHNKPRVLKIPTKKYPSSRGVGRRNPHRNSMIVTIAGGFHFPKRQLNPDALH